MTSLPVLGADGVHLGSGLRTHPSLRRVVLNIQHGPSSPLHSSVKQLFISQTIDLDIILEEGQTSAFLHNLQHICRVQHVSQKNGVRRLLHHVRHRCPSWHVFSQQRFVVFFTRNAVLIIFRVSAYISYEIFPWFLSFKVSLNEVK